MNPWKAPSGRKPSRPISPALILALVAAVASGFFFIRMQSAERRLEETRSWTQSVLDSLARSIETPPPPVGDEGRDSVYWQWVALGARMDARRFQNQLREARERRRDLLSATDLAALRDQGLADPVRQLRDSLLAHPELVRFREKDGGTMTIARDQVVLLERPLLFAGFGNGQVQGNALFAYRAEEGRVRWRRLWIELDSD